MKTLVLACAVFLAPAVILADNFYVYSRGQTYLGSYNSGGGYMIGPNLQLTQWGGRPQYTPQPMQYTPPGYYTMPVYQPYRPWWRW